MIKTANGVGEKATTRVEKKREKTEEIEIEVAIGMIERKKIEIEADTKKEGTKMIGEVEKKTAKKREMTIAIKIREKGTGTVAVEIRGIAVAEMEAEGAENMIVEIGIEDTMMWIEDTVMEIEDMMMIQDEVNGVVMNEAMGEEIIRHQEIGTGHVM
mmetsp:Transcript_6409/g.9639  ORF Transcript_6409/g.9639 Transcript_6409/m.9639 type:complete len:157 (+) Transcript_6409:192-662(+)